ncbi:MAG: hypothetical protein EAX81_02405 [Candidatus Thorarchaeota archaeon]|nr:hypothetical protein [Candidatus Thorarchaeota archaeon]
MNTKESLHQRSERKAIQIITDTVFGLALGLGAFSLTEYEISTIEDVYFAIGFFFLTFFLVSLFWVWVRRFFEDYVVYGETISGILYILCLLVAILPFIMRLFFSGFIGESGEVSFLAQTWLYPLDMGSIGMLVGSLHVLFLNQGRGRVPWEEYKHVVTDGYTAFVLGGGFLLSAAIPNNLTLADILFFSIPSPFADITAKIGVWFIVVLLAVIVYIPIELGLRGIEKSYTYTGQAL